MSVRKVGVRPAAAVAQLEPACPLVRHGNYKPKVCWGFQVVRPDKSRVIISGEPVFYADVGIYLSQVAGLAGGNRTLMHIRLAKGNPVEFYNFSILYKSAAARITHTHTPASSSSSSGSNMRVRV